MRLPSALDNEPVSQLSNFLFETRIAAESLSEYLSGSRLRLGVTGLSRSGKTVFITALVHQLTRALAAGTGRQTMLPVFRVLAEGRLQQRTWTRSRITMFPAFPMRSISPL